MALPLSSMKMVHMLIHCSYFVSFCVILASERQKSSSALMLLGELRTVIVLRMSLLVDVVVRLKR